MGRDFNPAGEVLVKLKFGAHYAGWGGFGVSGSLCRELGLADKSLEVVPTFWKRPLTPDDFGPNAPAEVLTMASIADIFLPLIHFDPDVLNAAALESQGVGPLVGGTLLPASTVTAGWIVPGSAGKALGRGLPLNCSGNHYVSLNMQYTQLEPGGSGACWRFPACYLAEQPYRWPIGTDASVVQAHFRAIIYVPLFASGAPTILPGTSTGEVLLNASGNYLCDVKLDN
jgi:hypothetical protein